MTEPLPTGEIPQLKVAKETVDRVLAEISENPRRIFLEEETIINFENPALYAVIASFFNVTNSHAYVEGAYLMHRILRTEYEGGGKKLPKVSEDIGRTYFVDREEEFNKDQSELDEYLLKRGERVYEKEPALRKAIKEFTKYTSSTWPRAGAVDIYLVIEKALKNKEMENSFRVASQ